jgi:mannose-6-phosphate isomerase
MPELIPFLLERKLVPKIWGGRGFERTPGFALPPGEAIGESWELFDRPEGSSRLRGSGTTLADVMARSRQQLLGRGVATGYGGHFPLLLKFVDAQEALSVQVHPNDEQAKDEHDSGKDEAWLVVHAGPRARVIRGVRPGVDRASLEAAASTAAIESMLLSFAPRDGDVIHLPPGTVHSVGPDVVVFEVQENSDVTYRLYDWGREREVHVDKALGVMRMNGGGVAVAERPVVAAQPTDDGGLLLLQTPHFRMRRYELQRPFTLASDGRYCTLTMLSGRGMLGWRSGGSDTPLPLGAGDTVVVPACVESVFLSPIGRLDVVVCDPGRRR